MSQHIDDSPTMDVKMDISESTTNSQESSIVSPLSDQKQIDRNNDELLFACDKINTKPMENLNKQKIETNDDGQALRIKPSVTHSSLTLVDEHPLMCGTDESTTPIDTPKDFVDPIESFKNAQEQSMSLAMASVSPEASIVSEKNDNIESNVRKDDSDESEPDLSQYEACVESSYQSVMLTNCASAKKRTPPKVSQLRKVPLTPELLQQCEDVSSLETFSNHSQDDGFDDNEVAGTSTAKNKTKTEHEYSDFGDNDDSAERPGDLSTVSITLADGSSRNIDMKVIEPYKRVLSHGGYMKAGGHNAIVIFSACFLPDKSRADYHYVMENLFLYVIKTLEQFVTEDYVLIYLHGGSTRSTVPPLSWLKKCYQLLDRRIRKSLKNLYMVHPTFWLKSLVWMTRPFISTKFWRKLVYVRSLDELYQKIPVERAAVPDKVKNYDMSRM